MPWLTQQINYSRNIIDTDKTTEMFFIGDRVALLIFIYHTMIRQNTGPGEAGFHNIIKN